MGHLSANALRRREFLLMGAAAASLLASTALTPALAQEPATPPFSFESLTVQMRALAAQPYQPKTWTLPDYLSTMDYDLYRRVQFRPKRGKDLGAGSGFQLQAFHMGWLYKEPVELFGVDAGAAGPIAFSPADFEYLDPALAKASAAAPFPGVAGFRINYPVNKPGIYDELIAFLGASYFRALGRGNFYGASARGIVVDSWHTLPEEFPRFSSYYFETAKAGGPLVVNATLEGPSVTGAYRFSIQPAGPDTQDTTIDVTARLFFRNDVAELGVAPLTSMFLYAESNRAGFDDYRPQVHDSNGLMIRKKSGEVMWRALNNPPALANSYFAEENPAAFGLMQRDRDFAAYQDAGAHYERRPSVLVEPKGDWGRGSVRLIEVPTKLEVEDNIVAFWVPEIPFKAGEAHEFEYRLRWGDISPDPAGAIAHVLETRSGQGGVSGVENAAALRKFVVDFSGGPLSTMDSKAKLDAVVEISAGKLLYKTVSPLPEPGTWRLAIDAELPSGTPVELRAHLVGMGQQLSETWLYQWRSA